MSKQSKQSRPQTETNNFERTVNTRPASVGGQGNSAPGKHKRSKQG